MRQLAEAERAELEKQVAGFEARLAADGVDQEALRGGGAAALALGNAPRATELLARLTDAAPGDAQAWQLLVRAIGCSAYSAWTALERSSCGVSYCACAQVIIMHISNGCLMRVNPGPRCQLFCSSRGLGVCSYAVCRSEHASAAAVQAEARGAAAEWKGAAAAYERARAALPAPDLDVLQGLAGALVADAQPQRAVEVRVPI